MKVLIDHILALTPEAGRDAAIQDVALCKLASESPSQSFAEFRQPLLGFIANWLEGTATPELDTEGGRHQFLLREIIDEIQNGRADALGRDEIQLVQSVHELAAKSASRQRHAHVLEITGSCMTAIGARLSKKEQEGVFTALERRLRFVRPEEIAASKPKEISLIAGIDSPSRGPYLEHTGNVRVLGDVPADCTMVIKDGYCVVDGYVTGRIASTRMCEIRRNASGFVVARDGDVRVRQIVDTAYVVSKRGSVYCRAMARPTLVFAGTSVNVRESVLEGKIISRSVVIGGTAAGAEIHVAREAIADQFLNSEARVSRIVFRRRLTSMDYGELPDKAVATLLSKARGLRERIQTAKTSARLAGEEAESTAKMAYMYILGGDQSRETLELVAKARRRLVVLRRIILALQTLYTRAADRITRMSGPRRGTQPVDRDDDGPSSTDDIVNELARLGEEAPLDADLAEEQTQIMAIQRELHKGGRVHSTMTGNLDRLSHRLDGWIAESKVLAEAIRLDESKAQSLVDFSRALPAGDRNVSSLTILNQIMKAIDGRPPTEPLVKRARSPFVTLLTKGIRARVGATALARRTVQKLTPDFEQAKDRLWDEYRIEIDFDNTEDSVEVKGRFAKGVHLISDPSLLDTTLASADGRYLLTPDSGDRYTVYACREGRIYEETAGKS